MSSAPQERAERLFRQREEGVKAVSEYHAREEAMRRLTAKLRAERLARQENFVSKDKQKKVVR
jgi:hypothetical protein